ncbi:MAG: PadR family transcriptional regulator [Myxococcales bacterium]
MLKYALLGFLLKQPMTGYDLERWIRSSLSYFWPAQLSQVYRTLKQLEDEGLVASEIAPQESRPDRRVYSATPSGLTDFAKWITPFVTEIDAIRVPFLVRFFMSGIRSPDDIITQLRILRGLYVKHEEELAQDVSAGIEQAKSTFPHTDLEPLLWDATRRAGELMTQAWIVWIDETIARLQDYQKQRQTKADKPPSPRRK